MVGNDRIMDSRHTNMYPQPSNTGFGIICIPEGMGSTMHGNQHRGIMVSYRNTVPHQLPRVVSCLPSPQDLCKQPEGLDLVENGQCIGSDLHQPKGWNTFNSIVQSSTAYLGVVYPERDNVTGRALAWQSECSGRHRIPDGQGSMRLDDQPQSVPKTTAITRSIRDRPDCISTDQAISPILQLEARPKAEATDAFLQNWAQARGLPTPHGV